jgi:hypothetical protein
VLALGAFYTLRRRQPTGIEWYRDLSITILAFVTTAALIFIAILVYRLYRTTRSTLLQVKAASKIAYDTVALVQECIKSAFKIQGLIQGICGGFEGISKMFKKESNTGGDCNE